MGLPETLTPVTSERLHFMVPERPDFGPTQVKIPEEKLVGKTLLFHRAERDLELGHKIRSGRIYEDPLNIKVLNVNLQKDAKTFDWLVDSELDDDGRSLSIEFCLHKSNMPFVFTSSRDFERLSLVRAGLAPDIHGNWHKYNWIEDPSKKERVAREIHISPILNSEALRKKRDYKEQNR